MSLRLLFMGTPQFAVPTLQAILASGHVILAVYTQPPRKAGRGMHERPSPVHLCAREAGLAVDTPASLRPPEIASKLVNHGADAAVVVAYGLLLPAAALAAPRMGCFNLHASLLPRWRGAAPINRAVMAGDRETGVTVMRMTEGLDEGPICLARKTAIAPGETAGELHDRLSRLGAALMIEALSRLEQGTLPEVPQPQEGATYALKIGKAEAQIDFARPARRVLDHIHGLSPAPGAFATLQAGEGAWRVKILKAEAAPGEERPGFVIDDDLAIACAAGAIRPLLLQREGKAPLERGEFLRGLAVKPGDRFI